MYNYVLSKFSENMKLSNPKKTCISLDWQEYPDNPVSYSELTGGFMAKSIEKSIVSDLNNTLSSGGRLDSPLKLPKTNTSPETEISVTTYSDQKTTISSKDGFFTPLKLLKPDTNLETELSVTTLSDQKPTILSKIDENNIKLENFSPHKSTYTNFIKGVERFSPVPVSPFAPIIENSSLPPTPKSRDNSSRPPSGLSILLAQNPSPINPKKDSPELIAIKSPLPTINERGFYSKSFDESYHTSSTIEFEIKEPAQSCAELSESDYWDFAEFVVEKGCDLNLDVNHERNSNGDLGYFQIKGCCIFASHAQSNGGVISESVNATIPSHIQAVNSDSEDELVYEDNELFYQNERVSDVSDVSDDLIFGGSFP